MIVAREARVKSGAPSTSVRSKEISAGKRRPWRVMPSASMWIIVAVAPAGLALLARVLEESGFGKEVVDALAEEVLDLVFPQTRGLIVHR